MIVWLVAVPFAIMGAGLAACLALLAWVRWFYRREISPYRP